MSCAGNRALSRVAAIGILVALIAVFCVGPLVAYCELIVDGYDALAAKAVLLQRYRQLTAGRPPAPAPVDVPLLYAEMPEAQVSALLQETLKTTAAAARVQIQGLHVLRGETLPGATRVGVRVRASGDIASLRGFLHAIETARPMLYLDNLQIQSHATSTAGALDFQLDVSGFKAESRS